MLMDWEGLLPDETNEAYHTRPELSSSDIKHRLDSAFHFKSNVLEKNKLEKKSNASFDLGSCAHECFLLQDTSQYVAIPEDAPNRPSSRQINAKKPSPETVAAIKWWEEFQAKNVGKRIITQDQLFSVNEMFNVIASNARACSYLDGSDVEKGARYLDAFTGLHCKFRPDIINLSKGFIADYKSAESASPYKFSKAVVRFGYHISAGHYLAGAERLWPGAIKDYFFIVQENSFPFAVAIYRMDPADRFRSVQLRNEIMGQIKQDYEKNTWPDWSEEVINLSIPGYAFSQAG